MVIIGTFGVIGLWSPPFISLCIKEPNDHF